MVCHEVRKGTAKRRDSGDSPGTPLYGKRTKKDETGGWGLMRLVVDLNRCQGYAQCAFLAPDIFAMHGEEALMYAPYAGEAQHEQVRRAVAACPVQAILADGIDERPSPEEAPSHGG
jgi:ferredoxin